MRSRTGSRRALAVLFALVVAAGAAVALLVDPIVSGGTQERDVADITDYSVDMVLSEDGTLRARETITVDYPIPRRGIFRIFDTADPRRDLEHPVEGLTVTRDGQSENWVWTDSARGTETARIGREDFYLTPGEYTYQLDWSTSDVLEPHVENGAEDPHTTDFWWDVIGAGWQMPIAGTTVNLELPAEPTSVECVIGESTPCEPVVEGTQLRLETGALSPFEPVTLRVGMPSDLVPPNDASGESPILALLGGALGLGLGLLGIRATREREPGFPVLYEPPEGVRPAVGVRVLDEKPADDELQSTLFDLGERGVVRIVADGESWKVEMEGDAIASSCESWEIKMLSALGLRSVGDSFAVSKSVAAGKKINKAKEVLAAGTTVAASPFLSRSGAGALVRTFAWLSAIGVIVMAGFSLFGGVDFPLWLITTPAGFAIGAAVVATDVGTATVRSEAGREVWSRTGGFARFLSTDSSESRFDAAAHMEWFPRYLPWAVALGLSEEWAARYEAQGVAPPDVPYVYGWGHGGYHHGGFSSFNSSFNSSIAAAGAAYAASQASSSGGGFSGGSGGGGGGGGSW